MHLSQAGLVMLLAHQVYGHGYVTNFKTDGLDNGGYLLNYYYQKKNGQAIPNVTAWSAENLDSGFIAPDNYTSPDIVCSVNGQPAGSTAQVKAGGTVSFTWNKWAHFGPVMTYVARCDGNCSTVDKTKLKFIKIDEAGIDFDTQEWAATKMVNNNLTWVTTVPETLAPGNYVFRHETIAVHGSYQLGGAQNYPQCFNIAITGSGTAKPEGVLATELYKPTDAGILFNPYVKTITNYTISGPTLFVDGAPKASSGSVSPSATASSSRRASLGTSKVAAVTTQAPVQTSSASKPTTVHSTQSFATKETGSISSSAPTPSGLCSKKPHASTVQLSTSLGAYAAGLSTLVPASTATATSGNDTEKLPALPAGFDVQAFIEWLLKVVGQSKISTRHARDFSH